MNTSTTITGLTGLTVVRFGSPMVTSFLRLFLSPFVLGIERPTEAKPGNGGSQITHNDKMKLLAAIAMLEAKVKATGETLTAAEQETYESALRVIGPID